MALILRCLRESWVPLSQPTAKWPMAWTNTGSIIFTTSLLIFGFQILKQFSLYETLGNAVIGLKLWHLLTYEPPVAWIVFFRVCCGSPCSSITPNQLSFGVDMYYARQVSLCARQFLNEEEFLHQFNRFISNIQGEVENWTWKESTMPASSENQDIDHYILPTNARVIHVSYKFSFYQSEIQRLPSIDRIDRCTKDAFCDMSRCFIFFEKYEHRVPIRIWHVSQYGCVRNFLQLRSLSICALWMSLRTRRISKKSRNAITFKFKHIRRGQIW